jgi:hypothetical protein
MSATQAYTAPFSLYPGRVFATCWQTAAWLSNLLASGTAPPATIAQGALAAYETFANGADAVAAWAAGAALNQEVINLAGVDALPLDLDATTQTYFVNRLTSVAAAASGLTNLVPLANPFGVSGALSAGQPAIADPGFLEWCVGFSAESPPWVATSGTVVPWPTVVSGINGGATAWMTIANTVLSVQGGVQTQAFDTAMRQYRLSSGVAANVSFVSGITGAYQQTNSIALWNGVVAMPLLLQDAATLTSSPAVLGNQQAATVRFILRNLCLQTAYLLISLRTAATDALVTAAMRRNETMMDLAARAGGGFEGWAEIARLNNIQPPYPGPTNVTVAASGTQLLMPGSVPLASGVLLPTYEANVLGTDYDFGPINGVQPPWLGDIQLIAGLANYRRALGRRIQTPLGTLIYHPSYGSRIPPEVGAVQDANEASRLAAYGKAALAQDPRTADVLSAVATIQPGFLATFSGSVQPIGPGSTPVSVNQVINPLP